MSSANKLKAISGGVKSIERVDGRADGDTLRLWESHKEQAMLWRALALLQIPATTLAIIAAMVMYFFADTVVEVPLQPKPGRYGTKTLPDSEYVNAATEVVNLIATYTPATARRQYTRAKQFLWEPALTEFEKSMMVEELRTIEETSRTQLFFINESMVKVDRFPEEDKVVVRLPGVRQKLISSQPMPPDELVYYIKMTTIPKNVTNEFGIVVVDLRLRKAGTKTIVKEDKAEIKKAKRNKTKTK
jgi:TraE protein